MNIFKDINYKKAKNEYLLVFVLLILLSFGMLSIILIGRNLNATISAQNTSQSNIRTASAYVAETLRKNDYAGKLSVCENIYGPGLALVIEDTLGENPTFRWIYYAEDRLYEVTASEGEIQPHYEQGEVICDLSSFALFYDEDSKTISLELMDSSLEKFTQTIALRNSKGLSVTGGSDE